MSWHVDVNLGVGGANRTRPAWPAEQLRCPSPRCLCMSWHIDLECPAGAPGAAVFIAEYGLAQNDVSNATLMTTISGVVRRLRRLRFVHLLRRHHCLFAPPSSSFFTTTASSRRHPATVILLLRHRRRLHLLRFLILLPHTYTHTHTPAPAPHNPRHHPRAQVDTALSFGCPYVMFWEVRGHLCVLELQSPPSPIARDNDRRCCCV